MRDKLTKISHRAVVNVASLDISRLNRGGQVSRREPLETAALPSNFQLQHECERQKRGNCIDTVQQSRALRSAQSGASARGRGNSRESK